MKVCSNWLFSTTFKYVCETSLPESLSFACVFLVCVVVSWVFFFWLTQNLKELCWQFKRGKKISILTTWRQSWGCGQADSCSWLFCAELKRSMYLYLCRCIRSGKSSKKEGTIQLRDGDTLGWRMEAITSQSWVLGLFKESLNDIHKHQARDRGWALSLRLMAKLQLFRLTSLVWKCY